MRKGCFITALIVLALLVYGFFTAFDPEYYHEEIAQRIGGKLICDAVYNADHQTWAYDVDYKYRTKNGDTLDLGSGRYYLREWKRNEQIIKQGNWLVLQTGGYFRSDKLLVGKTTIKNRKEIVIDPESIESDSLWKAKKIQSLLNYCCAESYISSFKNGNVSVDYKFRTDEKTDKMTAKKIFYRLNDQTGNLEMTDIE